MKISFPQENVVGVVNRIAHIAGKNTSLPILQNILLRVDEGGMTFVTTNLEIGVSATARGKVEEEGVITIPARLFLDYLQLLPQERVDLSTEGQKLHIACKNFQTTILGAPAEDFPLLPEPEEGEDIRLSARTMREGVGAVLYAAAPDETRPEISGVFLNVDQRKITFAATDSYRLAESERECATTAKGSRSVILPARAMQELVRILSDREEEITLRLGQSQAFVSGEDFSFTTRMVDGQYPDYKQIIPTTHKTRATLPTREFAKAVKGASLFAPSGVNDIHLTFHPGKREVVVSASSGQVGENRITIPGEVLGEENSIIFNWRYLMDGIDHAGGESVVLDIVNPTNPGVLRPKERKDFTYLVMPIKQ